MEVFGLKILASTEYDGILEALKKIEELEQINAVLEQDFDQALESISNLQKVLSKTKQELSDSHKWVKQLEDQNQNQINTIAKFVAQCNNAEHEKGLLKTSVAIALDNLNLEIKNIFEGV